MIFTRQKFQRWLLASIILGCLFAVAAFQRDLNHRREALNLTRVTPLENAPPMLEFTTKALGGFRGLIANALWIRMSDLQEEGKFFEMVQLADWITKLTPYVPSVWVHQSWNMAYNVSVKVPDHQDRWRWVSRAIELLRDEGIKYNPREPQIYQQLGWIFQHKMGHFMDDANETYKREWASEMDKLFAGKPDWATLLAPKTAAETERVRILKQKYKIDPAFMKKVDDTYGPLEWRLPEAHAIYWGAYGLEYAAPFARKKEDIPPLRRLIFQSLQLAFHRGKMVFPKKGAKEFIYGPNLQIVGATSKSYEEMIRLEPEMADNFTTAHKNFLGTAVYFLYSHNRRAAAKEWFEYLKKRYPDQAPDIKDLDAYALSRLSEDAKETDPNRIRALLEGFMENSFMALAMDEDDYAQGQELYAKLIWKHYMDEIGKMGEVRVGLPPLPQTREEVLKKMLSKEYGLDPVIIAQLRTKLGLPQEVEAPNETSQVTAPAPTGQTNAPAK